MTKDSMHRTSNLPTKFLMEFSASVLPELKIERDRRGRKLSICHFSGGTFLGPRLRGTLLPGGGDWAEYESKQLLRIHVKGTLKTHDEALIFLQYTGIWRTKPGVLQKVLSENGHKHFRKNENYLRVFASFETDAPAYSWLNEILAIGIGRKSATGVVYEFHELQ